MRVAVRFGAVGAAALAATTSVAFADGHLVICEVVLAPNQGEYIEIHNPGGVAVDLTNYYLADSELYGRTPLGFQTPEAGDFIVRFPAGASIPGGATIVVAFSGTDYCNWYHPGGECVLPAFEIPLVTLVDHPGIPDMQPAYRSAIQFGSNLTNTGEAVYLFFYDNVGDLIKDVDMVRAGQPNGSNDLVGKTGLSIDGNSDGTFTLYRPDAMLMNVMTVTAGNNLSHKRLFFGGASEVICGNDGNGLTGHDETNENIRASWDGVSVALSAPTPGVCGPLTNPTADCVGDIAPDPVDGAVNVTDLLALIAEWGPCDACADCPADICVSCTVNVNDLLVLIAHWGPCSIG